MELYCNGLPVFRFNSAEYNLILIKSYFLPIIVKEQDIEPSVIEKSNQFILFKFGVMHLLDIRKL